MRTLASIAEGKSSVPSQSTAVLLLIVNRGDSVKARACHEACPVWARYGIFNKKDFVLILLLVYVIFFNVLKEQMLILR